MDHDRLFKELLTTFFIEFVELFLPEVAACMDRDHLEFLDKEIFTDIASGERHEVDLLVKTRIRGQDVVFLIHVENQSRYEPGFAKRMFRYFARLYEKYGLPIFPVVLFSYDTPLRREPDHHRVEIQGHRVLDFTFRAIQLNQLNWRDYLRNPNPVANALMTKMRIVREDRPKVKLECLRMLATLRLDKARSTLISAFMESYLKLTAAEMIVYNKELETVEPAEREVVMQLTNEWIEQGKAEGLSEGLSQGLSQGRRLLVLRLLRRQFGDVPTEISDQVGRLSESLLDEMGEALLDFATLADAKTWLAEHS
ncbi:MAG TPA: DUF4351 domain-containing protein [Tepidisphaeraceae bacterium]|jgi:predicted transposase YdaD|nr:DUF4351 domain-containing protein [Tepidisphaeraceae bacterium]